MRAMNRSILPVAVAAAAIVTAVAAALPAQAMTPMPGSPCEMTGMVMTVAGKSYVCQRGTGNAGTWSPPLANTTSRLTMKDGWAKAAESGMSAAFGVVSNPTNKDIVIIGAASPLSSMVQIHEMVMKDGAMVMQEVTGGLKVPAKGSIELKPGGNHLMFMGIKRPIKPGQIVPMSLLTSDGGRLTVKVLAKNYSAANEQYNPGTM